MGEARRKAESLLISVLIPERGRPEMLERAICSLIDTAGPEERYEILVFIDSDDPEWADREPFEHSRTRYMRRPRPITLGEKLNEMARAATGSVFWFVANDYIMKTAGWPAIFRQAAARLPNKIGIPYVTDDMHPGHALFPLITREMMEVVGFAFAPWYPTWFIDTHWDEIGIMSDLRFQVPVEIEAPEGRGKTHGMIDLAFWVNAFNELRPTRMRDAIALAERAHGAESAAFADVMARIGERQAQCVARTRHLSSPAFLAQWGGNAASPPAPSYPDVKAYMERLVSRLRKETPRRVKVIVAVPSGRTYEAASANTIAAMAAHSAAAGIEVMMLNTQSSSISHNRNTLAKIAVDSDADFVFMIDSDMVFPPDTLMRLLKHDKDIVGALYCKRTFPHDLIGKLKGPKPEVMDDGLHEALYMPGGVMLIRVDVLRQLGYPQFAELFQFEGRDGLDAFKNLARNYFSEVPPEDVLVSLDGSPFGEWIRTNYALGLGGERYPYLSEDNFFIQRARRAGYTAWVDVAVSGTVIHLGQLEVTTLLPEQIRRLGPDPIQSTGSARRDGTLDGAYQEAAE
jgi:cellulose synthase/poly-beta-1,6-N-acetylglucosamine synthase-like glycosyltransferase